MPLDPSRIRAVVFDYGNTLIPYGREELDAYGDALRAALEKHFGPVDRAAFDAHRQAARMAPFAGAAPGYRENDLRALTVDLVAALYGAEADDAVLEDILRVRFEAFVVSVRAPARVPGVLDALRARYRLALLSNYPDGPAIRESLARIGIGDRFDAVVVSGDLGYCKPHPLPYAAALQALGCTAQEAVMVGDNWLADVQGAKRIGMACVHTLQYAPPEHFAPQPGDFAPDAAIAHLDELPALLGIGA